MIKSEPKRDTFDIWICEKEPFKQMYIKNTITCSWDDIEKACIIANSAIPETENIIIGYDLTSNR